MLYKIINCFKQESATSISFESIIDEYLKNTSFYQHHIKPIRDEKNDKERKQLKINLPALMMFDSNNCSRCQYISLDVDNISTEEEIQKVKNDLASICCLVFRSPSGNGVKGIIKFTESYHVGVWREVFQKISYYVETTFSLAIDHSCSNVNRLCFLSFDVDFIFDKDKTFDLNTVSICPTNAVVVTSSPKPYVHTTDKGRNHHNACCFAAAAFRSGKDIDFVKENISNSYSYMREATINDIVYWAIKSTEKQLTIEDLLTNDVKHIRGSATTGSGKTYTTCKVALDRANNNLYTYIIEPDKVNISSVYASLINDFNCPSNLIQVITSENNDDLRKDSRIIISHHTYFSPKFFENDFYKAFKSLLEVARTSEKSILVVIDEAEVYYNKCIVNIQTSASYRDDSTQSAYMQFSNYTTGQDYREGVHVKTQMRMLDVSCPRYISKENANSFLRLPVEQLNKGNVYDLPKFNQRITEIKPDHYYNAGIPVRPKKWIQSEMDKYASDMFVYYPQVLECVRLVEHMPVKDDKVIEWNSVSEDDPSCFVDGKWSNQLYDKKTDGVVFPYYSRSVNFSGWDMRCLKKILSYDNIKLVELSATYTQDTNTICKKISPNVRFDKVFNYEKRVNKLVFISYEKPIEWHHTKLDSLKSIVDGIATGMTLAEATNMYFYKQNVPIITFVGNKRDMDKVLEEKNPTYFYAFGENDNRFNSCKSNANNNNNILTYSRHSIGTGINLVDHLVCFATMKNRKPIHTFEMSEDPEEYTKKALVESTGQTYQNTSRILRVADYNQDEVRYIIVDKCSKEQAENVLLEKYKSQCKEVFHHHIEKKESQNFVIGCLIQYLNNGIFLQSSRAKVDWKAKWTVDIHKKLSKGVTVASIKQTMKYSKMPTDKQTAIDEIIKEFKNV